MTFDDFEILIASGSGGGLTFRASGQAGERTVQAQPVIDRTEALRFLRDLGAAVKPAAQDPGGSPPAAGESSAISTPAEIGRRLSRFLLPPELRPLWERCRALAEAGDRGLRLRLHFDLRQPDLAWLAVLPWELLVDEETGDFLALDGRTPVVRYLEVSQPRRPFPTSRRWRVLVVEAHPRGLQSLNLSDEREDLRTTWGDGEEVELVFPEDATFDGIRSALRRGPIDGLHYMGHAVFDEPTGRAGLIIETESGGAQALWGEQIRRLIHGSPPPALAVLNSCQTGRTGDAGSTERFGGAAAALMSAGVPAVVAMQLPINNRVATRFSKVLYRALRDRKTVDWAVSEARVSLATRFADRPVWAIPSLYMRVADGRLFAEEEAAETAGPVSVEVELQQIEESTVETRGHDYAQGDLPERLPETRVRMVAGKAKGSVIRTVGAQTRRK